MSSMTVKADVLAARFPVPWSADYFDGQHVSGWPSRLDVGMAEVHCSTSLDARGLSWGHRLSEPPDLRGDRSLPPPSTPVDLDQVQVVGEQLVVDLNSDLGQRDVVRQHVDFHDGL